MLVYTIFYYAEIDFIDKGKSEVISLYIKKKHLFNFLLLAYKTCVILYTNYPVGLNTYKEKREKLLQKAINGKKLGVVSPDLALLIYSNIWEECVCLFFKVCIMYVSLCLLYVYPVVCHITDCQRSMLLYEITASVLST